MIKKKHRVHVTVDIFPFNVLLLGLANAPEVFYSIVLEKQEDYALGYLDDNLGIFRHSREPPKTYTKCFR